MDTNEIIKYLDSQASDLTLNLINKVKNKLLKLMILYGEINSCSIINNEIVLEWGKKDILKITFKNINDQNQLVTDVHVIIVNKIFDL